MRDCDQPVWHRFCCDCVYDRMSCDHGDHMLTCKNKEADINFVVSVYIIEYIVITLNTYLYAKIREWDHVKFVLIAKLGPLVPWSP